jgi:hypothetical protein
MISIYLDFGSSSVSPGDCCVSTLRQANPIFKIVTYTKYKTFDSYPVLFSLLLAAELASLGTFNVGHT